MCASAGGSKNISYPLNYRTRIICAGVGVGMVLATIAFPFHLNLVKPNYVARGDKSRTQHRQKTSSRDGSVDLVE